MFNKKNYFLNKTKIRRQINKNKQNNYNLTTNKLFVLYLYIFYI